MITKHKIGGCNVEYSYNGLYSVFIVDKGFYRADTLKGLKQLIKEA